MSPLLTFFAVWLGLALVVIIAGLSIRTRTGPKRYVILRLIESEEAPIENAFEYREAA